MFRFCILAGILSTAVTGQYAACLTLFVLACVLAGLNAWEACGAYLPWEDDDADELDAAAE